MTMAETTPGRYFVIEGTDGAGTTTQKTLLKTDLEQLGRTVVEIAEPGGTPLGLSVRRIILDPELTRSRETDFDLFTICRRELAAQVIRPALQRGCDVTSDRNWFSTVAYQGFGDGMDVRRIIDISRDTLGDCFMPDGAVIIDIPVEVSKDRLRQRRGAQAADHFERRERAFFEKIREGYTWLADEFSLPLIDGTQSIEQVHTEIVSALRIVDF